MEGVVLFGFYSSSNSYVRSFVIYSGSISVMFSEYSMCCIIYHLLS
uniref:Uncharacterized protein n=1 Tax=Arundo donax TaxID=35708 RepID=A0A0A9FH27_ARUDO